MSNSNIKNITNQDWYIVQQLLYTWCTSVEIQELTILIKKSILTNTDRKQIWNLINLQRLNDKKNSLLLHEQIKKSLHKNIQQYNQLFINHHNLLILIILLIQILFFCIICYYIS